MKLIICEKPSLARNVKGAIPETFSPHEGYYEGKTYIVTYCFGHLFELYDADDYKYGPRSKKHDPWSPEQLPIVPDPFEYKLRKDCSKQFQIIKKLIARPDVECIIHCGDADREGELIVRNVLFQAHNKKPVYRLWLPEQTKKSIQYGLSHLPPDTNYNNLALEGQARTYIDWLFGINLTRYVTLASGTLQPCGRVLVPIVKAIYDRDTDIRNFQSKTYFICEHKGTKDGVSYVLDSAVKYDTRVDAARAAAKLNSSVLVVTDVTPKKVISHPPKLFSLSKLQGVLSKRYKMSLKSSMATIQGLYEKGYITYPRTNTEYLAEDEKDKVKEVIAMLQKHGKNLAFRDGKSIFDDSKIESHSALTPTYKYPVSLDTTEQKVYDTILARFCAVFCAEDCIIEKTSVTFTAGTNEKFHLNGAFVRQKGYLAYEPGAAREKEIPRFQKGDHVTAKFKPVEKHTSPPPHYTVEALMNFLKDPFKGEKKELDDTEEYRRMLEGVEIGTEATRTGIIENAKKNGYIAEKRGTFTILPKGETFIHNLDNLGVDLYKTKSVELGKLLKAVNRGDITIQDAVNQVHKELDSTIEKGNMKMSEAMKVGVCPWCGGDVYKKENRVFCKNHVYNRETKASSGCKLFFFTTSKCGEMSDQDVQDLLTKGKTDSTPMHGTTKTGREWQAHVALDPDGGKYCTKFVYDD